MTISIDRSLSPNHLLPFSDLTGGQACEGFGDSYGVGNPLDCGLNPQ